MGETGAGHGVRPEAPRGWLTAYVLDYPTDRRPDAVCFARAGLAAAGGQS